MQIPNEILNMRDKLEEAEFQVRRLKENFQTQVNLHAIKLAKEMGYEWGQVAVGAFYSERIKIDQIYGRLLRNEANTKEGVGPFWRMVVMAKGPRLTKHGVIDKRAGDTEVILKKDEGV